MFYLPIRARYRFPPDNKHGVVYHHAHRLLFVHGSLLVNPFLWWSCDPHYGFVVIFSFPLMSNAWRLNGEAVNRGQVTVIFSTPSSFTHKQLPWYDPELLYFDKIMCQRYKRHTEQHDFDEIWKFTMLTHTLFFRQFLSFVTCEEGMLLWKYSHL